MKTLRIIIFAALMCTCRASRNGRVGRNIGLRCTKTILRPLNNLMQKILNLGSRKKLQSMQVATSVDSSPCSRKLVAPAPPRSTATTTACDCDDARKAKVVELAEGRTVYTTFRDKESQPNFPPLETTITEPEGAKWILTPEFRQWDFNLHDLLEVYGNAKKLAQQGGMATMYGGKITTEGSEFPVAIKVIAKDPDYMPSMRNEVALLHKAQGNRHIVKLYEIYENEKDVVLVMEMCLGDDLCIAIFNHNDRAGGRRTTPRLITTHQMIQLTYQLLNVLLHLKERGIVHADIKTENLMITFLKETEEGLGDVVLTLIDFGEAMSVGGSMIKYHIGGTPACWSPELAMDKRYEDTDFTDKSTPGCTVYDAATCVRVKKYVVGPFSIKTDMWAAGVVIYELWSGEHFSSNLLDYGQKDGEKLLYGALFKTELARQKKIFTDLSDIMVENITIANALERTKARLEKDNMFIMLQAHNRYLNQEKHEPVFHLLRNIFVTESTRMNVQQLLNTGNKIFDAAVSATAPSWALKSSS